MATIIQLVSKFDATGIKKAHKAFEGLSGVLDKVGLGMGLHDLVDAAKLAAEDSKSFDLLATQMKRNAKATDGQVKSTEELLTKLSEQDGIVKSELYPSMTRLTNATKNVGAAQRLMQIALDAAAVSGKPLSAVTLALGKAYNGNTTALTRMFPELKKSKDAIGDLAKETKGAAEQKADPFKKFQAEMEALQIQIGTVVLPIMKALMDAFKVPGVKETAIAVGVLVAAMKAFSVISAAVEIALGILNTELIVMDGALTAMGWTLIVAAIAAVVAGIVYLATQTQFFQTVWDVLVQAFNAGINFMAGAWSSVVDAFNQAFTFIGNFFKSYINGWIGLFEGFINGVLHGINLMLGGLNAVLDGVNAASFGTIALHVSDIPDVKLPKLAKGGIVMPSPGGTNVTVGEGGRPEAIIPLNGRNGFGNTINIYVQSADPQAVIDAIGRYVKSNGKVPASLVKGFSR
jgi:hypothetical protein